MFVKIEKSFFGHQKIYDCNLCDTRKDYQVSQLQIESNCINICDDCLMELRNKITDYILNK